jgi:hypothetical protein
MPNLKQWQGLFSDADPHDIPEGGATLQDNWTCNRPGALTVRKGMTRYSFSTVTGATADVVGIYAFNPPVKSYIVFHTADAVSGGNVYLGNKAATVAIEGTAAGGTAVSINHPNCWCETRKGRLIRVNGVQRGTIYNGAAVYPIGITAPAAAPTVTTPVTGGASAGDYVVAYRYLDAQSIPSSLSPRATVTASASDQFSWDTLVASTETRVTSVELYRSTVGQATTLYLVKTLTHNGTVTSSANATGKVRFTLPTGHGVVVGDKIAVAGHSVAGYNATHGITAVAATTATSDVAYSADGTGGTWTLVGYTTDTDTDATIGALTALPIFNSDGSMNAYRFDPPPIDQSVCVRLQDRYFYGVPKKLAIADYITNVSGWTTAIVGHWLYREGFVPVEITAATTTGENAVTIGGVSTHVADLTGGPVVSCDPAVRNAWYYSEPDEPESVPVSQNEIIVQTNVEDNDEPTGIAPRGAWAWVFRERHTYRLTFSKQPNIDNGITLAFSRGCTNQRCWAVFEDTVFAMDEFGAWAIVGGQKKNVSDPVCNYWADPLIDWAHKDWFFASVEPTNATLRFHVVLTTDAAGVTHPMHALCMNIRSGEWWTESYPQEMGGACLSTLSSRSRLIVGGENGDVLMMDEGVYDVATPVHGTVTTASTGTTLTDATTAGFLAAHVGAPLVVTGGTGKGSVRYIVTRTSATAVVLNAALTVDTTSTYTVGAIRATFTSGLFELPEKEDDKEKGKRGVILGFQPTTAAETLDLSYTHDHETAAVTQFVQNTLGNVTSTAGTVYKSVNMQLAQNSNAHATGYQRWPLTAAADKRLLSHRWLSISMEAYQHDEELTVYEAGLD